MSGYSEANRAMWDERVPIHVDGEFYDLEGFVRGGSSNLPFEVEELGDVTGRSLVHLQCHIGKDTLSWARRGATVLLVRGEDGRYRLPEGTPSLPLMYSLRARRPA